MDTLANACDWDCVNRPKSYCIFGEPQKKRTSSRPSGVHMPKGLDTTQNCSPYAASIRAQGYDFIGRYLSKSTWKVINAPEASAISAAGLSLILVYEDGSTSASYFSNSRGQSDGQRAATQAAALSAPSKTALYFAVDYDASSADINGCITDYFNGVAQGLATAETDNGCPPYAIGAYGSGSTCLALAQAGLVQYTWLAQSRGWSGYDPNHLWSIVQGMPSTVGALSVDPDVAIGNNYGAIPPV
ncbi:DUF1906 domain-containing protein, partial [Streptomyces sp. NPDC055008]